MLFEKQPVLLMIENPIFQYFYHQYEAIVLYIFRNIYSKFLKMQQIT